MTEREREREREREKQRVLIIQTLSVGSLERVLWCAGICHGAISSHPIPCERVRVRLSPEENAPTTRPQPHHTTVQYSTAQRNKPVTHQAPLSGTGGEWSNLRTV